MADDMRNDLSPIGGKSSLEAAIRTGAIAALRKRAAARRAEAKTVDRPEARIATRIAEALDEIAAELEREARNGR